jgi:hypothetical protein
MKVYTTIVSAEPDAEPVPFTYYKGDSLPEAIEALVMATVRAQNDQPFVSTLSVHLEF